MPGLLAQEKMPSLEGRHYLAFRQGLAFWLRSAGTSFLLWTRRGCRQTSREAPDNGLLPPGLSAQLRPPELIAELVHSGLQEVGANSPGDVFLNKSRTSIGSKYKKAVYREYTDKTFTVQKERTGDQEHFAILGPLIKVNVGDNIKIIFKNKASRPYSIYAHGVKLENNEVKATEPDILGLEGFPLCHRVKYETLNNFLLELEESERFFRILDRTKLFTIDSMVLYMRRG
ncbi:unnamed protein product [Ranitomeya imitator]|uniref:Plastocyanin-like domain-containing protein n=1 Tax=Ranitomeya imitator TaxID=111125 RepID=A0ABN9LN24_9NEOB|nr:unnamed protein product [Ranitomeya imitator]